MARLKADFINNQKENTEKKKLVSNLAKEEILEEILPVIDSFEMAFANKEEWQKTDKNWRVGVEYIYTQLQNILKNHGLTEIKNNDKIFNPEIHSALDTVETKDEKENGEIEQILQKGYELNGKIIRLIKVRIKKFNSLE